MAAAKRGAGAPAPAPITPYRRLVLLKADLEYWEQMERIDSRNLVKAQKKLGFLRGQILMYSHDIEKKKFDRKNKRRAPPGERRQSRGEIWESPEEKNK